MQVTKLNTPVMQRCPEIKPVTDEQLQNEYDFLIADRLLSEMTDQGIIPKNNVNKFRQELAKEFSTIFADLLP
jgi:hypothetical protein